MAKRRICSIDGCGKASVSLGWCQKHYVRFKRHGDPHKTLTAPEGAGIAFLESLIGIGRDDCVVWPYSRNPQGYGQTYYSSEVMGAHRVMCILAHGEPPSPKHQAAHSCGNGRNGCVNPAHLRWATPKENIADKYELHRWVHTRDRLGRITGIMKT